MRDNNCKPIERNGDYFLHVTVYMPKEEKVHNRKVIGIDLGVKDQITFSNGIKVKYNVETPNRVKNYTRCFQDRNTTKKQKSVQKEGRKCLQR